MKKLKNILFAAIVGTFVLSAVTACGSSADNVVDNKEKEITASSDGAREVNIGFVDTSGANILLGSEGIARDNGYFEEEFEKIGVKVNLVPMSGAGPAINEALASGSLDIGILGDVPAVNGKSNGIDTTVIAFNGLNNFIVISANPDSGIDSVKDLKGKKVATQKGAFMHRLLLYALEEQGLTIDDIEFVPMTSQDALAALETKSIDAAVVQPNDVTYRLSRENGFKEILFSNNHEGWAAGSITEIRTEYLNSNPDVAVAFLKALLRANEYIEANENALKDQWIAAGYAADSYDYAYPNHDNYSSIEATDDVIENAKKTLAFLQENDLSDGDFDVDAWYDLSYYEKAKAEFEGSK
ncbi:MAG: transporter substrate-binding domain-containing protein [Pseudobutyrivibrio ruminis]|uniref:ABC transporter substrate-binding protein n=1 Tax=Pseudobutyrivibrio ruminis TaxID=46206 RepID=UPI0026F00885|nr:ABC transporter substrate-binding protein [Pseudobutyrivibrio ruminis]MBE5913176.1 transporter substrate-binding domain-containing protein [Pseudobutyrivibrio ruminis]